MVIHRFALLLVVESLAECHRTTSVFVHILEVLVLLDHEISKVFAWSHQNVSENTGNVIFLYIDFLRATGKTLANYHVRDLLFLGSVYTYRSQDRYLHTGLDTGI